MRFFAFLGNRFVPAKIPRKRRLQTMAVAIWSSGLVIMCCLFLFLWYVICYLLFILDRSPSYARSIRAWCKGASPSFLFIVNSLTLCVVCAWLILSSLVSNLLARTHRYGRFCWYTGYGYKWIQHLRLGEGYFRRWGEVNFGGILQSIILFREFAHFEGQDFKCWPLSTRLCKVMFICNHNDGVFVKTRVFCFYRKRIYLRIGLMCLDIIRMVCWIIVLILGLVWLIEDTLNL